MTSTFRAAVVAAVVPWILAVPAAAQGPADAVCDGTATAWSPTVITRRDLEALERCPARGAGVVAVAWGGTDALAEESRAALVRTSQRLRDERIHAAASRVARDAGRATEMRLAALAVLASYNDSSLGVSAEFLREARVGDPVPALVPALATPRGASRLSADHHARIRADVDELSRSDRDPAVRRAALVLRQAFAMRHPEQAALEPGAVRLIAGCGARVTLRSSSDIAIPAVIRVERGRFAHERLIPRAQSGRPVDILLGLPPGTVTVTVGDQVIARLTDRAAPCAPGQTRS